MSDLPALRPPAPRARGEDALLDGAVAGLTGGIVLIAWFVALDLGEGRDPRALGWVPGTVAERLVQTSAGILTPAEAALAGALLLLPACAAIAAVVVWVVTRLRPAPTFGATLTGTFAALLVAFFALDGATGGGLFMRLRPWSVLAAHALAATAASIVVRSRQPRLTEGRRDLWDDEP